MLYNIIFMVSAVVLILILSLLAWNCFTLGAEVYRKGIEHGKNLGSGKPSTAIIPKPKKKKAEKVEESDEVKRYNAILRNLDAFDGTPVGQEEING